MGRTREYPKKNHLALPRVNFFIQFIVPFKIFSAHMGRANQQVGRKRENPEKNHLTHPQAELSLSYMCAVWGSNPHQTQRWDDPEWLSAVINYQGRLSQVELGLYHMWPVWGSNTHVRTRRWDDRNQPSENKCWREDRSRVRSSTDNCDQAPGFNRWKINKWKKKTMHADSRLTTHFNPQMYDFSVKCSICESCIFFFSFLFFIF